MLAVRNTKTRSKWPKQTPPIARYASVNPEDFYWDPRIHTDEDNPGFSATVKWGMPKAGDSVEFHILEGLHGKEKQYVLKLGDLFEGLIRDGGPSVMLRPLTTYQRFLVYCCSVYFGLAFGVVPSTYEIYNVRTPSSHIPKRRISDMAPADLTTANLLLATNSSGPKAPPSPKIAKRQRMTTAEREASYNEARSRIFMDFEEKEKKKREAGNSANSTPAPASGAVVDETNEIGERNRTMAKRQAGDEEATDGALIFKDFEAERQKAYEEARARIFDLQENEKKKHKEGNSHPSLTPGAVMNESNDTGGRNIGSTSSKIVKKRYPSIAEREAAYEEARARIFSDVEKEEKKKRDSDGNFHASSTPPPASSAVIDDGNGIGERKAGTIAFHHEGPQPQTSIPNDQPKSRSGRSVLFSVPLETAVTSAIMGLHLNEIEEGSAFEEEISETTSISGSIYSHASSRTKSTDYGIYYRRMALSQESLLEGTSQVWKLKRT